MKHIVAALALLLSGAANAAAQAPALTVLSVYEGMGRYADAVTANPQSDRQALWREHVIIPYWKRCADGGEYVDYAPPAQAAMTDIPSLQAAVAALRAAAIEPVVRAAMEKSQSVLPAPETTVCIMATDSTWTHLLDMHGVGGFTAGVGKIWLTIRPIADWKNWIEYGVAHEHHHSAWTARHRGIADLTDYLMFEGRADSFAQLLYPMHDVPWTSALNPLQEKDAWRTISQHLRSTDGRLLQGLMHGGAEGTRLWAGYTVGFRIVQAFLKSHPEATIAQWTDMASEELLSQAGYEPGQ